MTVELLQTVLDGLPLAAFIIGQDERVVAANAGAAELLGPGIIGRHHVLTLRQPPVLQAISASLADRETRFARLVVPRAGREDVYSFSVAGLSQGGVICTFQDESARELAVQMRRDFVANVSHELRTPLTALIGFIETLRGPARQDPVARDRFLQIMEREAGRMNRLVRDLLHLSRVEAEEKVRPRTQTDLGQVVGLTLATLRPMIADAEVEIVMEGPWPASGPFLPGDPDQLMQVFTNLIENAVKYGGKGKQVTLRLMREEGVQTSGWRIDVADQGDGIPAVHIPRLTERFYRADTHRSRDEGGTGLGLAIVKHIVNRHRGNLRIQSMLAEGSTFSVFLPDEARV